MTSRVGERGRKVIEVIPGRHRRSLAGSLREKVRRTPADESWHALRDATFDRDQRRYGIAIREP